MQTKSVTHKYNQTPVQIFVLKYCLAENCEFLFLPTNTEG